MLAHCRAGGLHVSGCWVVDLALNKGVAFPAEPSATVDGSRDTGSS